MSTGPSPRLRNCIGSRSISRSSSSSSTGIGTPSSTPSCWQTTGGKERIARYAADYGPDGRAALDNLSALHKTKTRCYLDLLSKGALKLRPGVERLIDEARERDLKLAIATTSTPVNVKALLRSTLGEDAINWFTISAGDAAARKKPDPDIYYVALESLGVGPRHVIAFEDSVNGVNAAVAAGLTVVATPSMYLVDEDLSAAAAVVSNLGEPGRPFRHVAGSTFPRPHVDIDGLEALLDGVGR